MVDSDDVHCLMSGASGVGKTAYFLYPNLEYACASGMSFLTTDTKGDLYRNYGAIPRDYYGYHAVKTIASDLQLSRSAVKRALHDLVKADSLRRNHAIGRMGATPAIG